MPTKGSMFHFAHAPPRNLSFPNNANLTATELLTFFPLCLTSSDVVSRFAANNTTCNAILSIINTNRNLGKLWQSDYCYRTLRNTMRRAGHLDWTLNKHNSMFQEELVNFDNASLSMAGVRTSCQISGNGPADADIPFARLAEGVRNMPQGDDALDLTRMIHHCLQNPEEEWMYPRDYDALLQRIGGPKQQVPANTDRAVWARWEHVVPHVPRAPRPSKRSTPQREAQPRAPRQSGRRGRPSLKQRELLEEGSIDDLSETELDHSETEAEEKSVSDGYVRGPIRWVKPPPVPDDFSAQALHLVFNEYKSADTTDAFDAYAFGSGPRTTPPFRPLHFIHAPRFDDLGGWAENLRWAEEQHATFGVAGWTECPEHMEQIARIRQEQVWASDQLVLKMLDDQEQDEQDKQDEAWVQAMVNRELASMERLAADPRELMRGGRR